MSKKLFLSAFTFLLLSFTATSQVWTLVGAASFSNAVSIYTLTSLALDPSGNPWVAYQDANLSDKITVMKFDGANWVLVGTAGFSAGAANAVSLAFDGTGTAHVAYGDGGNGGRTTVMKYTSNGWVLVGTAGFSSGSSGDHTIKFGPGDTAFVAYVDQAFSGKAVVKKFNGTSWVNVGNPGFTPGGTGQMTMALNNAGVPYVGFQDQVNGFAESVMKYNGSGGWVNVGPTTFSAGTVQFTHITFNTAGTLPYVCYNTGSNPFAPNVQMYNGSNWVYVGGQNLNTNVDYQNNLALDGNDMPYVIFPDGGNNASVMAFNGSAWVYVGAPGFSAATITYPNIKIDANNDVYVEYYEQTNVNRITVMKYDVPTSTGTTHTDLGISVFPNPAGNYLSIRSDKGEYELRVLNIVGEEIFHNTYSQIENTVDISNWIPGVYFVELKTDEGSFTQRVVKGE